MIRLDVLKCQLKPVTARHYSVAFTPAQMTQLHSIFPTGVCDWKKPGVNQVKPAGTWIAF